VNQENSKLAGVALACEPAFGRLRAPNSLPHYLALFLLLVCIVVAAEPRHSRPDNQTQLAFLTQTASNLLQGCRVTAHDGTVLYTPDGKGNYKALWTRDFAYMVENAGDLIPPEHVESCIRYLLKGQRADGAIPDRVRPDGVAVFAGGGEDHPLGEPNLDNPQFLVIAADEHLKRMESKHSRALFREWAAQLDKGMDYLPLSASGLIFNDPQKPHSPYGFTDTVGKTGELFMESLLYWTACKRLAKWHREIGNRQKANAYQDRADQIEQHMGVLWDRSTGAFLAATKDCRQIDIWGNAYAIYAGFPLGKRQNAVVHFLTDNYARYVWHGQVRHLLKGEYWQRLLAPVAHERYQNGAYWATASGWVMFAIAQKQPGLAQTMLDELIADFKTGSSCECVNEAYRQLPSYVVSSTNPLGAARRVFVQ